MIWALSVTGFLFAPRRGCLIIGRRGIGTVQKSTLEQRQEDEGLAGGRNTQPCYVVAPAVLLNPVVRLRFSRRSRGALPIFIVGKLLRIPWRVATRLLNPSRSPIGVNRLRPRPAYLPVSSMLLHILAAASSIPIAATNGSTHSATSFSCCWRHG